jgi:hypothetical protein
MQVRRRDAGGVRSCAVFSGCGRFRFRLWRTWAAAPRLTFVMLNPSTADADRNDPTLARCESRARAGGWGGFEVLNLWALRTPFPADLWRAADRDHPFNARFLARLGRGRTIVCGWGNHGLRDARGAAVAAALMMAGADCRVLGLTARGAPCHPLYLRRDAELRPWADVAALR